MTMKRAIVLGGGMVGEAIARDLAADHRVLVADRSDAVLGRLKEKHGLETLEADLSDAGAIRKAVAEHDVVLGALPSPLGLAAMRAVIEEKKPYCDISFLPEDPRGLTDLAKEHGATVVYDCGVAPGMTHMMAGWGAAQLDECARIHMYVGGLPVERRVPYEYKAGFSPYDVIEEYTRPCTMIENGRRVVKPALTDLELVDIPRLGTLEAFNTDGLRSLLDTVRATEMREKTMRYPGHAALMKAFRETGLFQKEPVTVDGTAVVPLDVTSTLLFPKWTYDDREADLTAMRVVVEGTKGGEETRYTWTLLDYYDPATDTRSMSRTTGFPAAIMARMLLDGTFSEPGVHPPEVPAQRGRIFQTMLEALSERGVRYTSQVDRTAP